MSYQVEVRRALAELERASLLEVRRIDILARDLAKMVAQIKRVPDADDLVDWLEEHRLVTGCYANTRQLEDTLDRHLRPAFTSEEIIRDVRHPELESAVLQNPDELEPYLIYADWLQEQSDPLGTLISLGVPDDEESQKKFERFFTRNKEHFLGEEARGITARFQLDWRYGVIHAVSANQRATSDDWRALLKRRVCGFVHTLRVPIPWVHPGLQTTQTVAQEPLIEVIEACAPMSVRHLRLYAFDGLSISDSLVQRRLAKLSLSGAHLTAPQDIPEQVEEIELRVQRLQSSSGSFQWNCRALGFEFEPPVARVLGEGSFPRLESLRLSMSYAYEREVIEFLVRVKPPSLKRLELSGNLMSDATIHGILDLPVCGQLETLSLTNLALSDEQMRRICAMKSCLGNLQELDVSDNELTGAGLAEAEKLASTVISRRQNPPGTVARASIQQFAGTRYERGVELAHVAKWEDCGRAGAEFWGIYTGTERYLLTVSRDLSSYQCSCPSSYQPCKHVVALALMGHGSKLRSAPKPSEF